ncbi:MAG TPA: hypothetical protein DEP23_14315 [Ruminococcaceae bacterium]|nr:hypothetical protein [Oscillospiraceae bacterium]
MRFTGPFCLSGGEITAHPFIMINGKVFPAPARGLQFQIATTVSAGRNANNEVVGQKVGRDQQKIDNLYWPHLSAKIWAEMLQEFDKFEITVTYPNPLTNSWVTRKMYPGDRTMTPFKTSKTTGLPTEYINCKCNVVDMGLVNG